MRLHPQRGQVFPLVALFLVLCATSSLVLVRIATTMSGRSGAEHAAEAAALAGALDGEGSARAVAAANHAQIESFVAVDDTVTVQVRRGRHRAAARAERVIEVAGDRAAVGLAGAPDAEAPG